MSEDLSISAIRHTQVMDKLEGLPTREDIRNIAEQIVTEKLDNHIEVCGLQRQVLAKRTPTSIKIPDGLNSRDETKQMWGGIDLSDPSPESRDVDWVRLIKILTISAMTIGGMIAGYLGFAP